MKKDFLTITPESGGGGTAEVSVSADPNVLSKERSTTLNFSATGGLTKAVNALQNPAFSYHVISDFADFASPSKFKIENGVFLLPCDVSQKMGTTWNLKVYDPFSVITSIAGEYSDSFGIGDNEPVDNFISVSAGTGKLWTPQNLKAWTDQLPGDPGTLSIQLTINGTLAVKLYADS